MFVWASNGFGFFFSFLFNCRFAGLSSPVQSRTIRVWLKPLLVGGTSLLPRATSLMQKNTSWRCFVRCFYIKQFSSIVSVCQGEIKCIYFPVVLQRGILCWLWRLFPHGCGWPGMLESPRESFRAAPCAAPGAGIKDSCWVNHGFIPERKVGKLWELISVLSLSQRCRCAALFYILCKDDF